MALRVTLTETEGGRIEYKSRRILLMILERLHKCEKTIRAKEFIDLRVVGHRGHHDRLPFLITHVDALCSEI